MGIEQALIPSPETWLARERPDEPVFFFCPQRLGDVAGRFLDGFPGVVSYAVKANPLPEMIEGLWRAGLRVFDVASPAEKARNLPDGVGVVGCDLHGGRVSLCVHEDEFALASRGKGDHLGIEEPA